jgi:hypothetical protein
MRMAVAGEVFCYHKPLLFVRWPTAQTVLHVQQFILKSTVNLVCEVRSCSCNCSATPDGGECDFIRATMPPLNASSGLPKADNQ